MKRPASRIPVRPIDDPIRLALAFDLYAPLLTARQREALRLAVEEDLSLAEIAERLRIARQSVHERITAGRHSLDRYEARLGLVKRHLDLRDRLLQLARRADGSLQAGLARLAESL
jgi:hypothetical protein